MSKKNKKNNKNNEKRIPVKVGMDFGNGIGETVAYAIDMSGNEDAQPKVMKFEGVPQTVREMIRRHVAESKLITAERTICELKGQLQCEKTEVQRLVERLNNFKKSLREEIEKVDTLRKDAVKMNLKIIDFKCGFIPGAFIAGIVACGIVQGIYNYFCK